MRPLFTFLIVFAASFSAHPQQAQTDQSFIHIIEVENIPVQPKCNGSDLRCTLDQVRSFFLRNFNRNILSPTGAAGSVNFHLKFIINTEGRVAWASAQGTTAEIQAEAIKVIKQLPSFSPGSHQGEKTNVIVDLPLNIVYEDFSPEGSYFSVPNDELDSRAILRKCRSKENKEDCTSNEVSDHINTRLSVTKIEAGTHSGVVNFDIDTSGNVQWIIAEGTNEALLKEAIRVVRKLPDFLPGTQNGTAVTSSFSLPIFLMKM